MTSFATAFATVDSGPDAPLRLVVVGAGAMGRGWMRTVHASEEAELVGVVDLDPAAARDAVVELGVPDLPIGDDTVALARAAGAQAIVDVTVPEAHHPVTTAALFAGLPVLGEKPLAADLPRSLSLVATAELTGQLFMVSQSRRWNPHVAALRHLIGELGTVGALTASFFRAPRFGGFRDQMDQPLLVDMAIHPFDTARFLLGADPLRVYCESYNPPWSWYAGDANASAIFEMEGGSRFTYDGSWCAPGAETSWNGEWRASCENGTAHWDGETDPVSEPSPADGSPVPESPHSDIAGALAVFCSALRTGVAPMGEAHENLMSVAMVEAAVTSARSGSVVEVDALLARAHESAIAAEERPDVRARLASWSSVRDRTTPPTPRDPEEAGS